MYPGEFFHLTEEIFLATPSYMARIILPIIATYSSVVHVAQSYWWRCLILAGKRWLAHTEALKREMQVSGRMDWENLLSPVARRRNKWRMSLLMLSRETTTVTGFHHALAFHVRVVSYLIHGIKERQSLLKHGNEGGTR